MTAEEPAFNELIHAPQRLRTCAMLNGAKRVEFRVLQDQLGLSKSALSKHLTLLVDAGYVRQERAPRNSRNRLWLSLTPEGPRALAVADQEQAHARSLRGRYGGHASDRARPAGREGTARGRPGTVRDAGVGEVRMGPDDGPVTSRRAQIARLRQVALAALDRYPLPEGRLRFVAHGENTTFRHDSAAGQHLVRVHRPLRHGPAVDSGAAIRSELTWLRAIRSESDLSVPEPVVATDGSMTVEASAAGETRVCSVLGWLPGRIHEESGRPVHLRRLGDALARLHVQADGWRPPPDFVRIRWDHEAFFGDVMVYGKTSAAGCWALLPPEVRARFDAVAARAEDVMERTDDWGLIHADPHLGNTVFRRGDAGLIDFDDCGTGHRVYDVAVALWELRDEPDYPRFRDALLAGYRAHRDIDVGQLDEFIAVRQIAFDLWYTGMAQVNPVFADRLDVVHRWSLSMLDEVEDTAPAGRHP